MKTDQFRIGEITVDPLRNRIRGNGQAVSVEPKVMDLLVQLAAFPNTVQTRAVLIDEVWGVDHGGDESLTRAISALRHALDEIDPGKRYIETVPKRGYRLVADVEPVSGEGKRAPGLTRFPGVQKPARLALLTGAILVVLIILTAFALIPFQTEADRLDRIAIGSIDPSSSDDAALQTAKALETAIIRELTLGGVEVVRGAGATDTALLLSGSITRIGARDVVTVQVDDTRSTQTLWSREFELEDDIDTLVQYRIPWAVGDTVSCGLLGNSVQGDPLTDARLLGFFIRACGQFRTDGSFANLLVQSRKALASSPENPVARVRVAIAAAWAATRANSAEEKRQLIELAFRTSDDLIAEYRGYGVAHYARGMAHMAARNWASARRDLRIAQDLAPEYPYTLNALSQLSANLGYSEEAFDLKRQAVVNDRFSLVQPVQLAFMLAEREELPEALAIANDLRPIDPDTACITEFTLHYWWGDVGTARALAKSDCVSGGLSQQAYDCMQAFLDFRLGQANPAATLEACKIESPWPAERYAAATGSSAEAFSIAMSSDISQAQPWFLFRSEMKPLWTDLRFMQVAARYGLTRSWLELGLWPDFCSDPSLPYDCELVARQTERPAPS